MEPASPALTPGFGWRDILVALAMNVLWGLNIIAIKVSVDAVSPLTAALLRQAIVFIVCATALQIVPGKMRALTAIGLLTGGAFYAAMNLSLAVATNVGALAIAGQLGVPFALLLTIIVFNERIHLPRMIGIALSLIGVGTLVFDPAAAGELLGLAIMAVASLIWAISTLVQRLLIGVRILTIYAWIGLWGTISLGLFAWALEPEAFAAMPQIRLHTLGWIAFSAIGSTVMGHGAMSWLLQRHSVGVVTPLTLAAPVISVFIGSWYFNTPVTAIMMIGGALAMLGVAIVTIRTAQATTL
jgi:O-acetylserine/cysteine efflux transporter